MLIDPGIAGEPQSVSAAYIGSVLPPLLAHYRLDQADVLARAGIDAAQLARADALLPLVDVLRLFLVILEQTGDDGLGFETGRLVQARSYQVLGYALLASADLGQAIQRLLRFEKLAGNLGTAKLTPGDPVRLSWQCPVTGTPARFVTEAAITGWVSFARQLVGDATTEIAPLAAFFRHAAPADRQRYERWFGCQVHFQAAFDGVELAPAMLSLPLRGADPGLAQLMEREAAALLADYDAGTNLVNAVRSQLYQMLSDGEPGIEAVAARMGLAVRTLQSRLQRHGVSFQALLDGLRRSLAELYLRDPALSLSDIALLLGFAEQSSFNRAFRRWRGQSPTAFRRQQ